MSKKIFQSTFLVAMITTVITILIITVSLYLVLERQTLSELDTEILVLSAGIEQGGLEYLDKLTDIHRHITLVDSDGNVLYDNQSRYKNGKNISHMPTINDALEKGEGKSSKYSKKLMKQRVIYAQRLPDGTVLRMSAGRDSIFSILLGLLGPLLGLLAGTAFLSILLSRLVTRNILKPINKLDLEHPDKNRIYGELVPLLEKIERQNELLRHSLDEEMQERESRQSEFIANMSHEMKTPLTSISGFAELLKDGDLPKETIQDFSQTIYDESNRLLLLANDIIKLSMLEQRDTAYEWEEIDILGLCEEICQRLAQSTEKEQIQLAAGGDRVSIRGVRRIVSEMIYNLVDNAIKYNQKNGQVKVLVKGEESRITVQVKDTGIGIPKAEQHRIFDRFYRVDKSHSRAAGGTGLGLSIVKRGALLHHARIRIESSQGKGTDIAIDFPVKAAADSLEKAASEDMVLPEPGAM